MPHAQGHQMPACLDHSSPQLSVHLGSPVFHEGTSSDEGDPKKWDKNIESENGHQMPYSCGHQMPEVTRNSSDLVHNSDHAVLFAALRRRFSANRAPQ